MWRVREHATVKMFFGKKNRHRALFKLKTTRSCTHVNKHTRTAYNGTILSGCPRFWLLKMPLQIEIANSLRRTDIFQLDAHKGQAPHLKARAEGDGSVAVVTTEIWQPQLSTTSALLTLSVGCSGSGIMGSK